MSYVQTETRGLRESISIISLYMRCDIYSVFDAFELKIRKPNCLGVLNAVPTACLESSAKISNSKCKKIDACEKKKKQYKYVQPRRPEPCRPIPQTHKCDAPFAEDSVYSRSYHMYDVCGVREKPVMHKDHLVMAGEFQDETVHKLSYPVQCAEAVQKIVPRDHCFGGTGPMRLTTTQKHDFYIQCTDREKKIVPQGNLITSDCPMTCLTTNNCSYQPVCADPVESYKPVVCYSAPVDDMDLNTVHRSSYKKVELPEKPDTPWAAKLSYCKPKDTVECSTVYNYSYKEPGEYVLDECCDVVKCCEEQQRFIKADEFDD